MTRWNFHSKWQDHIPNLFFFCFNNNIFWNTPSYYTLILKNCIASAEQSTLVRQSSIALQVC